MRSYLLRRWIKFQASRIKGQSLLILDKPVSFWIPWLMILPALIVVALFTIYPAIITIDRSGNYLEDPRFNINQMVQNFGAVYERVADDVFFQTGMRNSVIYALLSLPLTLIIAILISSAIAHVYKQIARGFWQTIFFLPYLTNSVAIAMSFAYLFQTSGGIINSILGDQIQWLDSGDKEGFRAFWVILIEGIWRNLAFNVLLFTTSMLSVDKNNYKAASIDGAGTVKQFFTITMPSIQKTTNLLITLGIIGGLKVFPLALFNNNPNLANLNGGATMMTYITGKVRAGGVSDFADSAAASVIMFALGLAFTIVLRGGYGRLLKLISWRLEQNVYNKVSAWKKTAKVQS
ncbi:carbohydrate ABC transporter permease [Mycoplasmopsis agassizii]|uniref:carbohydrate ABC transporter permease n=1 Tax=Mycoplasmopsis agassizii TaxID=33922 RepID=UPI0035278053